MNKLCKTKYNHSYLYMPEDDAQKWGQALVDKVVWFIFAVILAFGTSYFNVRLQIEAINQKINRVQKDLQRIRKETNVNEKTIQDTKIRTIRIENKINALLQSQGIDVWGDKTLQQENPSNDQ